MKLHVVTYINIYLYINLELYDQTKMIIPMNRLINYLKWLKDDDPLDDDPSLDDQNYNAWTKDAGMRMPLWELDLY